MNTIPNHPKRFRWWLFLGFATLLVVLGIFIRLPHRIQTIEAHSTLQNGMKMEARAVLQSPHGWASPTRMVGLEVWLNGKPAPVAKKAYYGLEPFDPSQKAHIAETKGFPEIIMSGDPQGSFTEVRWRFLNYIFSELDMVRGRYEDISFYGASPPPGRQIKIAQYDAPQPVIVVGEESVRKTLPSDPAK